MKLFCGQRVILILCCFLHYFIVDVLKNVDAKATETYKLIWVFTARPAYMRFSISIKNSIFEP